MYKYTLPSVYKSQSREYYRDYNPTTSPTTLYCLVKSIHSTETTKAVYLWTIDQNLDHTVVLWGSGTYRCAIGCSDHPQWCADTHPTMSISHCQSIQCIMHSAQLLPVSLVMWTCSWTHSARYHGSRPISSRYCSQWYQSQENSNHYLFLMNFLFSNSFSILLSCFVLLDNKPRTASGCDKCTWYQRWLLESLTETNIVLLLAIWLHLFVINQCDLLF